MGRFYLNNPLTSENLVDAGLVNEITEDPRGRALEIAETLNQMAPLGLEIIKKNAQMAFEAAYNNVIETETASQRFLGATEDYQEGLKAPSSKKERRTFRVDKKNIFGVKEFYMAAREFTTEEQQLFQEIKNGRTFDKGDELPPLYDKALRNLLWMQGDSEYSGALGYMPWIEKAPNVKERVIVGQITKDEMRHASVIYKILEGLGEDTETHIKNTDMGYKLEEDKINIGFKRVKNDYRVNIFYYGINYWTDFILFNFLMDRAAGHQLHDTLQCSYLLGKKELKASTKKRSCTLLTETNGSESSQKMSKIKNSSRKDSTFGGRVS